MWALITEACLGYSLDIPDWLFCLVLLFFVFSLPFFVVRLFRILFN